MTELIKKKPTNKEIAFCILRQKLTDWRMVVNSTNVMAHADCMNIKVRKGRAEKIALMANEVMLSFVERRLEKYLEGRGMEIDKTALHRAVYGEDSDG